MIYQTGRITKAIALLFLSSSVFLLNGCFGGSDNEDLRKQIEDIKSRPGGKISSPPKIKPIEKVLYSMEGIADPFKIIKIGGGPIIEKIDDPSINSKFCPDPDRPRELLEGYTLDSLMMVGSMAQDDSMWALIRSPEGTVHRLKPGEYLGQNSGEITNIDGTKIELVERVRTGKRCKLRDAVLTLNDAGK